MKIFDKSGIIHLHSTLSDGNATPEEIIRCGKAAGLDFIILTDHDTLAARRAGYEGWHDELLFLIGYEISPDKNHYLALGTQDVVGINTTPQESINAVKEAGGFGIIAHPDHRGVAHFNLPSFAWTDWGVTGYDAASIWDLMTDWQHRARTKLVAAKNLLFPARCLLGPEKVTLERWDRINLERREPLPAIGECDNHGLPVSLLGHPIPILPYDKALRMVHTHVWLTEDWGRDVAENYRIILQAIGKGHCYVAQEWWKSAKGFTYTLRLGESDLLGGAAVEDWQGGEFHIETPQTARISLLCNGVVKAQSHGRVLKQPADSAGVWRVEAFAHMGGKLRPWIYSNPFHLL